MYSSVRSLSTDATRIGKSLTQAAAVSFISLTPFYIIRQTSSIAFHSESDQLIAHRKTPVWELQSRLARRESPSQIYEFPPLVLPVSSKQRKRGEAIGSRETI